MKLLEDAGFFYFTCQLTTLGEASRGHMVHGTWRTHRPSDAGEQAVLPGKPSESSGWALVFRAQKTYTFNLAFFVCILM